MASKLKWSIFYLFFGALPLFYSWLPESARFHPADGTLDALTFAPYLTLFLVALLGLQVNQTRVFWAAGLLFLTYHLLLHPNAFWLKETTHPVAWQVLAAGFPLSLVILYGMKESRLFSDWSLARVLLGLFPVFLFASWAAWAPDLYEKVLFWSSYPPVTHHTLPPLAWVDALPFLALLFWGHDQKLKPFLIAQTAVLLPYWTALQWGLRERSPGSFPDPVAETILPFGALALILLFALFRIFVQKAYWDPLTAVHNRQALDERLNTLTQDYVLAMVDIDHFKGFNDTYGHDEGDNVLRMVAQHLQDALGDRVHRYGGEEFCVVFEAGGLESAQASMEKVRASLAARRFTLRGKRTGTHSRLKNPFKRKEPRGKRVGITISVGVAASGERTETFEQVIKKADQALYKAKEQGRNRVVTA
ncbi:MAG TPA: GGDEF domain-containing protein [bacterium]|nr:GGDEF domain-containing protein [bacterium]